MIAGREWTSVMEPHVPAFAAAHPVDLPIPIAFTPASTTCVRHLHTRARLRRKHLDARECMIALARLQSDMRGHGLDVFMCMYTYVLARIVGQGNVLSCSSEPHGCGRPSRPSLRLSSSATTQRRRTPTRLSMRRCRPAPACPCTCTAELLLHRCVTCQDSPSISRARRCIN